MGLVLYNGKIRTEKGFAEAVACEHGRILAVGSDEEIMGESRNGWEKIDLEGRLVLPGFHDSHLHFLNIGENYQQCDLSSTKSLEEALDTLKAFIAEKKIKPGNWVGAYGWNEDHWTEKRKWNRKDLDQVSQAHPIFATRVCVHVSAVNSYALERLGIGRGTPQPASGAYGFDKDGEPDGLLYEAGEMIHAARPEPSVEEIKEMLAAVCAEANKAGITSVQSDDFNSIPGRNFNHIIQAYRELAEEGRLTVRVYEQCAFSSADRLEAFFEAGYRSGDGDAMYRLGPLKLFCDGSLGARTAWLTKEYADDPGNLGIPIYKEPEELFTLVEKAHRAGMAVAIHCIGDAAADQAIEAIERAMKKYPEIKNRHGLVHAQILTRPLCERMQKAGIIAYIQPIFIEYDLHMAESRVGSQRIKTSYNWRDMKDMGIPLLFGSDSPVESFRPVANIYSAVTRKDMEGQPEGGWYPRQALTLDESIDAYTKWPAYASYEEEQKGTITPGKYADFTVLEEDLYQIEPAAIKDVEVYMTIVNGKICYRAGESSSLKERK